jgi:hypothetical protein
MMQKRPFDEFNVIADNLVHEPASPDATGAKTYWIPAGK